MTAWGYVYSQITMILFNFWPKNLAQIAIACSFFFLISKVVQCHIEGGIDVYDRVTLKHLYRLNGHEYGGQCVELSGK